MDGKLGGLIFFMLLLAFSLVPYHKGFPASFPESTRAILEKLKLDSSILSGIDKELRVPKEWINKAKAEGKVKIISTADTKQAKMFFAPFRERYPFISVRYSIGTREVRVIKPLIAHRSGRVITDITSGLGGAFNEYRKANAVEDLRGIPGLDNVPAKAKATDGLWVGINTSYWGIAYNTKLVKKEDLPKEWEDVLSSPRWRGGNLALGNRPQLWAVQLWLAKGGDWTKNFLTKLFREIKPQLRKEGMSAIAELLGAGEFHAAIPGQGAGIYRKALEGAPLGYTSPEPVPVIVTDAAILKGSPNLNAARILMNWILSKEGQLAQFASTYAVPVHKDLIRPEFIPFADRNFLKKDMSYMSADLEQDVMPELNRLWRDLWLKGN